MIHKFANVHPEAQIGKNVTIEAFATVDKDVVIGDDSRIDSNAVIRSGARIGKNVHIFSGAVIAEIPQDLKFRGEITTAEIGDNTVVREFATVNRGTQAKGKTVVGKNCLLMAYTHVAHDCILGNNVIMVNASQIAGEVELGDYVILGGSTLIHQFCKVGKHAMAQGGTSLSKDVPPYVIVGRRPARYSGINSIGLRRRGFSDEQVETINSIYRIIFTKGLNYSTAIEEVKNTIPQCPEREEVVTFFEHSDRGIISGKRNS